MFIGLELPKTRSFFTNNVIIVTCITDFLNKSDFLVQYYKPVYCFNRSLYEK